MLFRDNNQSKKNHPGKRWWWLHGKGQNGTGWWLFGRPYLPLHFYFCLPTSPTSDIQSLTSAAKIPNSLSQLPDLGSAFLSCMYTVARWAQRLARSGTLASVPCPRIPLQADIEFFFGCPSSNDIYCPRGGGLVTTIPSSSLLPDITKLEQNQERQSLDSPSTGEHKQANSIHVRNNSR